MTSSSTASPVRPASSRAATRAATSRPHAVDGARIAHGCLVARQRPRPRRRRLPRRSRRRGARSRRRPNSSSTSGSGSVDRDRERRCRSSAAAAPSSSRVPCARSGSAQRPSPAARPGRERRQPSRLGATRVARARRVRRNARQRRVDLLVERCVRPAVAGPVDGHHLHRADPGGRRRPGPRDRRRGRRRRCVRMRVGGHCRAARRVDLGRFAEPLGAREDRGQRDFGLQPAVVVLAARVDPVVVDGEVAHAGEERQVEQLARPRGRPGRCRRRPSCGR